MSRAVLLAPEAEQDLQRLETFLATKSPHAAARAAQLIVKRVLSLAETPNRGYRGPKSLRQIVVPYGRDGYVIRYRVYPDRVLVTRIFHGRQRR